MPKLLTTPFATDALPEMRTDIQNTTGVAPNSATYSVGFPPVTMQPLSTGGLPPKGSDFNGILYDITDNIVFQTQGNTYPYNAAYATEIGGYPLNARISLDNGDIVRSTIASNTNNPNTDMTGWVYDSGYDSVTQFELNELTKTLRNFNPDSTASTSSQLSILDYLQTLPLNTGSPVQTPSGFANGGIIRIPRGRYLVTSPIKLARGTRIVGESHESTQIISRSTTGVFVYEDDGGYVPDEIVFENISIWQDVAYVPTAGAAIQVKEGAYTSAVQFILKNVMIEGTYKGVEVISGIGCSFDNVSVLKAVSHGIDINNKGNSSLSTTSTTLKNTYTFLNGGNGVNIVGSSYVSLVGTASDANTGYGYYATAANGLNLLGVGAERNTAGNFYLKDITSAVASLHQVTQTGAVNGMTLNNVSGLVLLSPNFLADSGNTGNAIHFEASARNVTFIGGTVQNFANVSNNTGSVYRVNGQTGTGITRGGNTNNWTFGSVAAVDSTAQIANVGTTETGTIHGFKNVITYSSAGATYNTGTFNQVVTAATAVTYPLIVGSYIDNAFAGAGSTITRSAGEYIKEQTRGSTANANLMIDASLGTVPAGNWSIYNQSSRPNYHGGSTQLNGGLGLFGTTPVTSKRSITGKISPTTQTETNAVLSSIVNALVAYGLVTDDRTA